MTANPADTPEVAGLHSLHLAELPPVLTARSFLRPPSARSVPGLVHAEVMAQMQLGAPVVSPSRMQLRRVAMFASWRDEAALESFLAEDPLGRRMADGWHIRLEFLRRWGSLEALADLPERAGALAPNEPVVAVTVARMKLPQLPRFLHWGRPVETQVRDHPATTLAGAAMRPPRTICTFSVWQTVRDMVAMVHGRGDGDEARRHVEAMAERERKDFHHEFTTLRFRPLSEHGAWLGRVGIIQTTAERP